MDPVFLKQQITRLRDEGFLSIANPTMAAELMALLPRPEFNEVAYVDGIGTWAVQGYIYMPKAKSKIIEEVQDDIAEREKELASHKKALALLTHEN